MHNIHTYSSILHADTPLREMLHLFQADLLSLPALVFRYEFWVGVKHRILAFGQRREVRKQILGMDIRWCAVHDAVGLLYHVPDVHAVTMVEEILRRAKRMLGVLWGRG